ncbi:erythromycin esterase family protein [Nonomuraea angiospora]|uniref:erythromycin esterase family protein n=1 Tax=Nonomuraea angiospora TaxID=46172 RepID=UPI0029A45521|nr:erythromycin esterase family protein [Nonomuraea angiospora]MDX3109683.1 erythromycin esterase family protein [Nonomuraea angiospora]
MESAILDSGWPFEGAAITKLLRSFPAPPRLLGLGEPTHGEEAFLRRRNEVFRHLVEHEGHRSIAIESDCLAALIVDAYVTEGAGTLDDVMRRGFSHGLGGSAANRELVSWMREHNRHRPAAERVRFFGFDGPLELAGPAGPRPALAGLHGYLAAHLDVPPFDTIDRLLGADSRWTNPDATMDPTRSVGRSPEAVELRLMADDLAALLTAESPRLIAATSREAWWRACLFGRTATGLLRYHAGMADTSPSRVVRLMGLRDTMMAENLLALAPHYGPLLVHAHNRHLQRDRSVWRTAGWQGGDLLLEWWSAGSIVAAQLGEEYAFIASTAGAASPPDTLEGVLRAALPHDAYLIASKRLAGALKGVELAPPADTSSGYFALDPGQVDTTDGILFLRTTTPAE